MRSSLTILAAIAAAILLPHGSAFAQDDPTQIGGGQLPYILIVMDTSASTEWTDKGDETYPERPGTVFSTNPTTFTPGDFMSIGVSGEPEQAGGPDMFGPCVVWEPDTCGDYHRPAWTFEAPQEWTEHYNDSSLMYQRQETFVRETTTLLTDNPGARLREESQPRHVTIKEILTGDMVLMTTNQRDAGVDPLTLDADTHGPGCWFVPRQRGATIQNDPVYCDGESAFEDLPDHDAPFPHFQEVYDAQKPNGLLDQLSGAAIFAFAAFDGYPRDISWEDNLNDRMRNSAPTVPIYRESGDPTENDDCNWVDENGNPFTSKCYDLGLYKVVGPHDLQIPSTFLGELSSYTQVAIRDAGYLDLDSGSKFELDPDDKKADEKPWMGVRFSKDFSKYVDKFLLGKQPIARGTPLAAAIHDANQFFQHGQDGMEPIQKDEFAQCRQKHVVMITDGFPEPERGPIGALGSDRLNPAFGYYEGRYTYGPTENEITALRTDSQNLIPPDGTGFDAQYSPRVHIVGLKDEDADEQTAVLTKLHKMAAAGQTCAEYYLSSDWYGTTKNNCARAPAGACIDTSVSVPYPFIAPDGSSFTCRYPAIVLNTDDPGEMRAALSEIFNSIIDNAGVASRTRAVVASRLDDTSEPSGGQYRFFSGVKIGGSPYWGGIINRQRILCSGGTPDVDALHIDINSQVDNVASPPTDSRRIFTSMPDESVFNYVPGDYRFLPISGSDEMFFAHYNIDDISTDEFGGSSMSLDNPTSLVGKRIPFEAEFVFNGGPSALPETDKASLFNVDDKAEFGEVVDNYRGRILDKADRALSGILNGNPVVLGPPDLDLPSESYRAYKARHGDRPTMMYVPTMDGLLHAIHTGENVGRIKVRQKRRGSTAPSDTTAATNDATKQREAWAYMPFMFLRELSSMVNSQPYLMDGTPAVKDVRLCHQNPDFNTNEAACRSVCDSCGAFPAERQWRSVLVQGLGLAGTGYFALDVTRPGQLEPDGGVLSVTNPDPIPLWEFTPEWERLQVQKLLGSSSTEDRVLPTNVSDAPDDVSPCSDDMEFWEQSLMGISVSDPEIATVLIKNDDFSGSPQIQRPVAVFGGGAIDSDRTGCGAKGAGQAIYVVDLQTGSLIRRFVDFKHPDGSMYTFAKGGPSGDPGTLVGSPAMYDSFPGNIATRGFVGDSFGRLFRIDFTDPDPLNWEVSLFFDPEDTSAFGDDVRDQRNARADLNNDPFGPAAYKPAIALNEDREPIVVYGLGEVGDVVPNNQAQAMIALREDQLSGDATLEWFLVFEEGEKLTGAPLIFNREVFFPTYFVEDENKCEPGLARIYQLNYQPESGGPNPEGRVDETLATSNNLEVDSSNDPPYWFGPTESAIIRGLTLTLGEICSVDNIGSNTQTFVEDAQPQPELIAQTGGVDVNSGLQNARGGQTGLDTDLNRLVTPVKPPGSEVVPLSWSVISN